MWKLRLYASLANTQSNDEQAHRLASKALACRVKIIRPLSGLHAAPYHAGGTATVELGGI